MSQKKAGKKYWVGFDLGGTKMMATVFNDRFKPLASDRVKTRAQGGARQVLSRLLDTIQGAVSQAHLKMSAISGIGVGCPGPLDLDRGVILTAPNLGWQNVPLKQTLGKTFGCAVTIANDVDAGLYGEYRFGAAQKARCALGVFPGTGLGGACVYEGRLFRGQRSSCMEIGHIPVQPGGRLCGCGQRGCLETVASRLAIASEAAMAAHRGEAPHLLDLAGTDVGAMKSGTLAKAIEAGDRGVEQIVRNAAQMLGTALAGVVNLLAPDVLVLGGGLVEAMPNLFLGEVRKAVEGKAMKIFTSELKIVVARLGDAATALGAAALAAADVAEKEESDS
ncbi:MAG: ROK family protein [Verrucomicrobia bacterium]|nr:ROK family protein [Verrucomicrobiota bacterium]